MTNKLSLFKSWLLLLVLMVGSSAAWADEFEWDLSKASYSASSTDEVTWSGNYVSMTLAKGSSQTNANNYLGGSGSYVHTRFYMGQVLSWTPATGISISSITITTTGSSYNAGFKEGTWTNATASASGTTVTITPTTGTNPVSCVIKSATRATKVKVTYTTGGDSQKDDCDLALTGAPLALTFDLYDNANAQVINYTTSSTGAITVVANEYVETTVNENAKTISVTPKKKTSSAQTITVNQAADDNYNAGSATFTVSIDDSTPFTGGDVTFDATVDTGTSPLEKNGVTFTCSSGALNNGSEYRLYKNSTTTFSVTSGNITKIVFTGTSSNPASGFGTQTGFTTDGNNGTWEGSATEVSFTASGAQVRATQIVVTVENVGTVSPSITANNVNIAYDATSGSFKFTIANPVNGGTTTISEDIDWISDAAISGNVVTFTTTANETTTARSGVITLTYTYGSETVTKNITITQAAAPAPVVTYTTIPALFTDATSTATEVTVTFGGWVVSAVKGSNAYLTDNQGNGLIIYASSHGFQVNDVLTGTASCKLQTYRGSAELTNLTSTTDGLTVTAGGTVTAQTIAINTLSGVNTGALVAYTGLTYNGTALVDGDNNAITPYNTLYSGTFENGKEYNVKGIYLQYNNTKELLPRSADDIEEVVSTTPTLDVSPANVTVPYTGGSGDFTVTPNNVNGIFGGYVTFYDPTNTETTTDEPSWINISYDPSNLTLSYSVTDENQTGEDRTACFKYFIMCDNNGAWSNLITVTQAKYVAPALGYATLPFSFDDGKADIEDTDGLTQEGLGSDYNSSPKLRFDNTGDWLLLHFDERPGTLTFDIKGNSFSGGTFKVQTSEDGTTYSDLETYTDLSTTQNEEFNNLGENVRYIKWIYTNKDAGNVALGNISLATYTAPVLTPSITVDPDAVNAPASAATPGSFIEGTLDITYKDLSITNMNDFDVQFYDGDGNDCASPSWIEVLVAEQDPSIGEGYVVSYVLDENPDAADRSAYFKIYALDDATNIVYSNLVTITQAKYVVPGTSYQYALFTGDLVEGDYVIYYDGYAMNTTVDKDRLQYAEVTPANDVITTDNAAIVWHIAKSGEYWTIYNADADAYAAGTGVKNKAQILDDGTDDKALWTVTKENGTFEFVNKANAAANVNANLRNNGTYGFACYATGTGGALSLYKRVTEEVTITSAGYATYCSDKALDFTGITNLTAYRATVASGKVTFETVTKVPANEGVLLKGVENTETIFSVPVIESAEPIENDLVGVLTATTITEPGIFVLMNQNNKVGFYKTTKAFTVGAHTAYLPALANSTRDFIWFGDDTTTGIGNLNLDLNDNKVYNLQGQRVNKAQKGLYIVNGKKVVLK